jgi:predicted O-methyltransferase YrrM
MFYRLVSFMRYYWRAKTAFNVQSPFLHEFVQQVLDTDKMYHAYIRLEQERKYLLQDSSSIEITDHGAGSYTKQTHLRRVKDIAASALSNSRKCRLIFQMINHYGCKRILELGTSLGLSSAYMACATAEGHIVTMEGDPNIASIAQNLHQRMGLKHIDIVVGPFVDNISQVTTKDTLWDMLFIDGHHSEEPTYRYFCELLPHCHDQSMIIIDDIYWSSGMTRAWHKIKSHPDVTLSIDLYDIGIIFINPSLSREAFTYLPYKYKPWKIGLWGNV